MSAATAADTMTVTVRDTAAEAANWGRGRGGVVTRTVTVSAFCRVCGERRGDPYGHNFYADGDWAWVQRWDNPCGHVDMYEYVIAEAATYATATKQGVHA